jgi:HPt (histidine-containing phosphotransfer) domain-containing protein
VQQIEQALDLGDCGPAGDAAHTLKSSSAQIGAEQLSELCRQLETAADAGELEASRCLLETLVLAADATRAALLEALGEKRDG